MMEAYLANANDTITTLRAAAEVRYRRDRVVSLHRVLTTAELFNR